MDDSRTAPIFLTLTFDLNQDFSETNFLSLPVRDFRLIKSIFVSNQKVLYVVEQVKTDRNK